MANENNTPPSIRLPENDPPLRGRSIRRDTVIAGAAVVLLVGIAIWFATFAVMAAQTPRQLIDRREGADGLTVQEEVAMVSLPAMGQRSVLFYLSGDQLACALLEHKASGYRVLETAGTLPLTSADKPGIWMTSGMQSSQKEFFVFGLLYDPGLNEVRVNGERAALVDNGVFRCWYYYGAGPVSINSESVVYS